MNEKLGFKTEIWEKTEAKEIGEYESLKLGGHQVKIIKAELYTGQSGNTSLRVLVDIAGNDPQRDYFKNQYDSNENAEKKWAIAGTRYLSLKEENLAYTKGFIKALENSNKDFKFDLNKDWSQIETLFCAGVFGLEEYEAQDGNVKVGTRLINFRSLDKLNEIKIPRVKKIDGSYIDYEKYQGQTESQVKQVFNDASIEIKEEDLPF